MFFNHHHFCVTRVPFTLNYQINHPFRLQLLCRRFSQRMSEDLSPAVAVRSDSMAHDGRRKGQLEASAHLEDVSIATSDTQAPEAPINWPAWKRNAQILMVAIHSMVCVFMAAGIIPGYESMAEEYKITVPQASYLTSVQVCIFLSLDPDVS